MKPTRRGFLGVIGAAIGAAVAPKAKAHGETWLDNVGPLQKETIEFDLEADSDLKPRFLITGSEASKGIQELRIFSGPTIDATSVDGGGWRDFIEGYKEVEIDIDVEYLGWWRQWLGQDIDIADQLNALTYEFPTLNIDYVYLHAKISVLKVEAHSTIGTGCLATVHAVVSEGWTIG